MKQKLIVYLKQNRVVLLVALFLIISFLLSGIICVTKYDNEAKKVLAQFFFGTNEDVAAIFFRLFWWRFLLYCFVCFFSLWILSIPFALASMLFLLGFWGVNFTLVVMLAVFPYSIWVYPLYLIILLITVVVFMKQCILSTHNIKRAFYERNIPKTSMDVYQEAKPFYIKSLLHLLVFLFVTMLEAIAISKLMSLILF